MSKLITIKKVFHTFGLIELLRLICRKFILSKNKIAERNLISLEKSNSIDEVLGQLSEYDEIFSQADMVALRIEFDIVFDSVLGAKRESFFNSHYDLGEKLAFLSYCLIRVVKPKLVIETGVAAGISSTLILSALEKNHYGTLTSFDITNKVGELIPGRLRILWTLKVLNGFNLRNKFRKEITKVKENFIFLHDSNHAFKWQRFELLACISTGKSRFFLIDDVSPELVKFLKNTFTQNNLFLFQEEGKISAFGYL
jgi:hypothetical protein